MKKLCSIISMFFLIYPINFVWFPNFSSRIFLGFLGVGLFVVDRLNNKRALLEHYVFFIVKYLIWLLLWAYLAMFLGKSNDSSLVKYFCTLIIYAFAVYFVLWVITVYFNNIFDFRKVLVIVSHAFVIQYLLVLLLLLFPRFNDFFYSIVEMAVSIEQIERHGEHRIWGVGMAFYYAGVINCFSLMVLSFLICTEQKEKQLCYYVFIFLSISIVGTFMARTTIMGVLFSTFYIVYYRRSKFFWFIIIISLFVFLLSYVVSENFIKNNQDFFDFAFELFYNFEDKGTLETTSTNRLQSMFYTLPDNLYTWIFGDGYFKDPQDNSLYYRMVDIGYLRLIFYFGLVGAISYYMFFYILTRKSYQYYKNYKSYFLLHYILFMVLSLKGMAEYTIFFYLINITCLMQSGMEQIKEKL